MVRSTTTTTTGKAWFRIQSAALCLSLTQTYLVGELTPHGTFITRPPEEVPEDEEWRSSRPVPATAYFDGLCEDLVSLKLIPVPGGPSSLYWEMWEAPDDECTNPHNRNFLTWANVSFTMSFSSK
jgi:hypothetical protein